MDTGQEGEGKKKGDQMEAGLALQMRASGTWTPFYGRGDALGRPEEGQMAT